MQSRSLLRIAAAIMLLHTIGHTFGALNWQHAPNERVADVIAGMNREHFVFMRRSSTLAAFYSGYGIIMIFVLLFISLQLWMLSTRPVKSQLTALAVFLLALSVIEYIYFFPTAALFTFVAGMCTFFSIRPAPRQAMA